MCEETRLYRVPEDWLARESEVLQRHVNVTGQKLPYILYPGVIVLGDDVVEDIENLSSNKILKMVTL